MMPDEPQQPAEETEPEEQPKPGNGGAETAEGAAETIKAELTEARALLPAVRGAVQPATWGDSVTMARDMARARLMLPSHLHNNPGDCLAIVDMSFRRGLSPYMVGAMTYEQNGKLCFMSQLFVAFLYASDELLGSLHIEWMGEGDELVCEVSGRLKRDPAELKVLRSMPLKHLHPGHVEKSGKKYVVGSPLWDRKPRQQIAYDTQRDWVRLYCPTATLGMYTPDEIASESGIMRAGPGLQERLLSGDRVVSSEGFDEKQIAEELARSVPKGSIRSLTDMDTRGTDTPKPKAKVRARPGRPARPLTRAQIKAAADRAERRKRR